MERGVFLDSGSLGPDIDLDGIAATLPQWSFHEETAPVDAGERIRDADVVITNKVLLDAGALATARRLRLVCVAATGVNNVDLDAAARQGITVCNVTAYATPSVVQHVFALMLALATRLPDYREAVRAGNWQRSRHFALLDHPIVELDGRTLGIVGHGELGRAVARAAGAFGMQVLIAARPGSAPGEGRMAFDELLGRVDVLSLHCPLTDATRGLVGARELARMKRDALLINTARGGIVDEAALAAALRAGVIAGAGIDVLASEPPSAGSPLLAADIPNLIVTPHIAWASRESRRRLVAALQENIVAFGAGRPRNVVTTSR